jgi:hypothetical protein
MMIFKFECIILPETWCHIKSNHINIEDYDYRCRHYFAFVFFFFFLCIPSSSCSRALPLSLLSVSQEKKRCNLISFVYARQRNTAQHAHLYDGNKVVREREGHDMIYSCGFFFLIYMTLMFIFLFSIVEYFYHFLFYVRNKYCLVFSFSTIYQFNVSRPTRQKRVSTYSTSASISSNACFTTGDVCWKVSRSSLLIEREKNNRIEREREQESRFLLALFHSVNDLSPTVELLILLLSCWFAATAVR